VVGQLQQAFWAAADRQGLIGRIGHRPSHVTSDFIDLDGPQCVVIGGREPRLRRAEGHDPT